MIGGKVAGKTPLAAPIRVAAGEVAIAVEAPRHTTFHQDVTAAGGKLTTVNATLASETSDTVTTPPVQTPERTERYVPAGWRVAAFTTGAFGIAGIATGAVFGGFVASKTSDSRPHCPAKACDAVGWVDIADAKTFATVSTISFIAGGVLVAGLPCSSWSRRTRRARWRSSRCSDPASWASEVRCEASPSSRRCRIALARIRMRRDYGLGDYTELDGGLDAGTDASRDVVLTKTRARASRRACRRFPRVDAHRVRRGVQAELRGQLRNAHGRRRGPTAPAAVCTCSCSLTKPGCTSLLVTSGDAGTCANQTSQSVTWAGGCASLTSVPAQGVKIAVTPSGNGTCAPDGGVAKPDASFTDHGGCASSTPRRPAAAKTVFACRIQRPT